MSFKADGGEQSERDTLGVKDLPASKVSIGDCLGHLDCLFPTRYERSVDFAKTGPEKIEIDTGTIEDSTHFFRSHGSFPRRYSRFVKFPWREISTIPTFSKIFSKLPTIKNIFRNTHTQSFLFSLGRSLPKTVPLSGRLELDDPLSDCQSLLQSSPFITEHSRTSWLRHGRSRDCF